jgi:hypothetical protein
VTGRTVRSWSGGASVSQVRDLLESVLAAPGHSRADQALIRGDQAVADRDAAAAITAYDEALAASTPDWKGRERAVEELFLALQLKGDSRLCIERTLDLAPRLPRRHAFVNAVFVGMSCFVSAPSDVATASQAAALETLAIEAQALPVAGEDDVYQLYEVRYFARRRLEDSAGAHAIAEQYWAYTRQRPAPRSDDERMARDLAKVRAAVKVGAPERVIPTLEVSERDLPNDCEASSRLSTAYTAAGRFDDGIAAATRGLGRGPGPEATVRLLQARATAESRKGDVVAARADLHTALDSAARIPAPSSRDGLSARVRQQLAALDAGK